MDSSAIAYDLDNLNAFVTGPAMSTMWARGVCERFDHLNWPYYNTTDRTHGYMETRDRSACRAGTEQEHLAPAISMLRAGPYAPVAELAAAGKRAAKALPRLGRLDLRMRRPDDAHYRHRSGWPRGFALRREFH